MDRDDRAPDRETGPLRPVDDLVLHLWAVVLTALPVPAALIDDRGLVLDANDSGRQALETGRHQPDEWTLHPIDDTGHVRLATLTATGNLNFNADVTAADPATDINLDADSDSIGGGQINLKPVIIP